MKYTDKIKHGTKWRKIVIPIVSIAVLGGAGIGIYFGIFANKSNASSLALSRYSVNDTIVYSSTTSDNTALIELKKDGVNDVN
jgi:hypothetical protein